MSKVARLEQPQVLRDPHLFCFASAFFDVRSISALASTCAQMHNADENHCNWKAFWQQAHQDRNLEQDLTLLQRSKQRDHTLVSEIDLDMPGNFIYRSVNIDNQHLSDSLSNVILSDVKEDDASPRFYMHTNYYVMKGDEDHLIFCVESKVLGFFSCVGADPDLRGRVVAEDKVIVIKAVMIDGHPLLEERRISINRGDKALACVKMRGGDIVVISPIRLCVYSDVCILELKWKQPWTHQVQIATDDIGGLLIHDVHRTIIFSFVCGKVVVEVNINKHSKLRHTLHNYAFFEGGYAIHLITGAVVDDVYHNAKVCFMKRDLYFPLPNHMLHLVEDTFAKNIQPAYPSFALA